MKFPLAAAALTAVLGAVAGPARAQSPPAGTDIRNTASAGYMSASLPEASTSNTVSTRVLATFGLRVTPPGSVAAPAFRLQASPGDTVYCRLGLENLGNAPDSAAMSTAILPPAGLTVTSVVFFLDADGDGRLDAGEDTPAFLALDAGASTPVDVAIVLPAAGVGVAYLELRATSMSDPGLGPRDTPALAPASAATVVRVTSLASPPAIYFGPIGNARALPGGEGSRDDTQDTSIGLYAETVTLAGDIENAGDADSIEVYSAYGFPLPPGVTFACTDASGVPFPASARPGRFVIGAFAFGETRPVRLIVSSPGTPLRLSLGGSPVIAFGAQSRTDTLVTNTTFFRIAAAQPGDLRTMIGLDQTFRQATAAIGDVVTMVVTATNLTDSVRVDNVQVAESVPPALDFLSGPDVARAGAGLVWRAGPLAPGESRTTAVKFAINSREKKGWARVSGSARGAAQTGGTATAGPVVAALRVDNEDIGIEGLLLGDVWIDADGDGRRRAGERGIPNVSVFLESGEYAVSDSLGAFSIPHVFEGYRVVRIDPGTLPADVEFGADPAADPTVRRPGEKLVHLIAPGHARVAFPMRERVLPPVERTAMVAGVERIDVAPRARLYRAFSLPSSNFPSGKAEPNGGAESELQPVAFFLIDQPGWVALVEGHTDNVPVSKGPYASNHELSIARAEAVRDALVGLGVDPARFVVRGYGDTHPIAGNGTAEGRSLNRRVEVSFIPPGPDGADPALRIGTAVRDLSTLPDSAGGSVCWTLTTTSEHPLHGRLRVDVPPALHAASIEALLDDAHLAGDRGAFAFDGLVRGRALRIRIALVMAAADTSAIRGVTATITVADSSAADAASHGAERTAVIHASAVGSGGSAPPAFDVMSWTQMAAAPALETPAPAAAPPAAPDTASADPDAVVILDPRDGFVSTDRDQVQVRASHPLGRPASLWVDGLRVDDSHVGQRTIDVAHQRETTSWYGVRLRAGWSTVAVRTALPQGDESADSVRVALSSRPAEIVPLDARVLIPADGRFTGTVRFAVRDGFGLPVMDGFVVTIAEGGDLVDVADARPAERGLQAATSGGLITATVKPRRATGERRLAVEADGMRAETEVVFVSPERPLFVTGIVDVAMGTYRKRGDGDGLGVANFRDGFDAEAESRVFAQGVAPGGFNVTARVDTRKRYDDPLLKEPDPERQYPLLGDASSVQYAAPARGGNYVSIDRGQSYLRYGDFRTPIDRGEFLSFQQSATGLVASLTDGPHAARAFVTETDFVTRIDEIAAKGTSGFYYLTNAPIVENSERVLVETRDRYQPEKVLESRVMARRRDYTINPYDGSILFMEPVAATDRELNPNRIVVTYEVDSGTSGVLLLGLRADAAAGTRYRAGVTAVSNHGDGPGYSLFGGDGDVQLGGVRVTGEVARSEDEVVGDGNAYKVGALAQHGTSKLDLYLRRVDGDFSNPSFRNADGERASLKAGFDGRVPLTKSLLLNADGYTHELQRTDERRGTARATVDYRRRLLEMSAGLRVARHDEPTGDAHGTLALAGVTVGNPGTAGVQTTLEQNLGDEVVDDYPNRIKTVLAIPLSQRFRAIATHEYLTASGHASTQQITAGVEGGIADGTQAYSRYALDQAAGDARMGAVSGVRQKLRVSPTTGATLGVETFTSLSGRRDEEYVSLTTGIGSRRPGRYFVDGGYEYRWERMGDKHLLRVSAAQQLGGGFAWLVKNVAGVGRRDDRNDETQFYTTLAGTYRSPWAPVQSLGMLKSYYDRYSPVDPDAIRWRLVASADVNVFPRPVHELRFKYAYKRVEDWSYGESKTTNTDLALAQYVWHFGHGWDLDTWGRAVVLHGGTLQAGTGIELGRMVFRSVRLGAGYSINGFEDPDVSQAEAWSAGFGVRVQLLLSDQLLADFEGLR